MAIKFKLVERPEPGVVGGGTKKWYAAVINDGEVTIDDLVKSIEKFSALSEPDIRGVIIALENVIQDELSKSRIVRLEKLGNLYPSLSSEGVADPADFTTAALNYPNTSFFRGVEYHVLRVQRSALSTH